MAHRMFSDAAGREWLVWDVIPQATDRREVADRREIEDRRTDGGWDPSRESAADYDRRLGIPRRVMDLRRVEIEGAATEPRTGRALSHLPRNFSAGWLCFESGEDRRRLGPIPPEWEHASDGQLQALLAEATVVPARGTHLDTAKMRAMVRPASAGPSPG